MTPRPIFDDTRDATESDHTSTRSRLPGALVVFSGSEPVCLPLPFDAGRLLLGRAAERLSALQDERLSRQHAQIAVTGERWTVRDLHSRNGTFVDGVEVREAVDVTRPRVVRVGDTIVVPCPDLRLPPSPGDASIVAGFALRAALEGVDRAARTSDTLLVRGESGTGKELAARRYHAAGPHAGGPFVAVNCAAIPRELAERLLFGTKRGAYSGASADAAGHIEMAHGGVLFLDEVGELELDVQAKLLRVLETREVTPLGASAARRVDVHVCLATHRDLRQLVADGKFREDLYHRVVPPEVLLPPLRERIDEIPHHMASAVARAGAALRMHAKLVESCMLRAWPGNVRELRKEVYHAAVRAADEGSGRVRLDHLSDAAGLRIETRDDPGGAAQRAYVRWGKELTREQIERALDASGGSVAAAAKQLRMQRTQLYREMKRWGIERRSDA